ncbi:MAG: biopolymer transporter ExbD [Bacteroidota bacterium]
MAEIDSSGGGHGKKGGKQRAKKLSTKIDMTPMVDLGFLLITFFMLTTTLQKPSVMQLNMPDKNDKSETTPQPASKTLAVIPGPKNKVYYFNGDPKDEALPIGVTDYTANGIRKVILEHKAKIGEKFVVVIMAMDKASYKNVVDLLDEMAITGSERYAMVDAAPTIIEKLKKSGKFVE